MLPVNDLLLACGHHKPSPPDMNDVLALLFVAAWACAGTAGKLRGCAESQCNPIQANIGGMVLVLSTGSMMRAATGGASPP